MSLKGVNSMLDSMASDIKELKGLTNLLAWFFVEQSIRFEVNTSFTERYKSVYWSVFFFIETNTQKVSMEKVKEVNKLVREAKKERNKSEKYYTVKVSVKESKFDTPGFVVHVYHKITF